MNFSRCNLLLPVLVLLLVMTSSGFAQDSTLVLLRDFDEGWDKSWVEREIAGKSTYYEVTPTDNDDLALKAYSEQSGSALWHMLSLIAGTQGQISWNWRIDHTLSGDVSEKRKIGDDFAARVYVVFEPHFVSWKTRALCYVWAAKLPVGSTFRNPYSSSVGVIVLQSGNENEDDWIAEERDLFADYRMIFNEEPEMITAVAIMTDTDNTKQDTEAWFDDLVLTVSGTKKAPKKEKTKPGIRF